MARFKVEQVRDPDRHAGTERAGKVVRGRTVDESKVSATRASMRESMRRNPQESSDIIRVTKR